MDHSFDTWWKWFMHINPDIKGLWNDQPSYILTQLVFIFGGIITLIHAFKKGGRWPWLWFAILIHGQITDNTWPLLLPDLDNFWHSQSPIMFFGGRMSLYIILLYPAFVYTAAYSVYLLDLPLLSEVCAIALMTVLIDLPYDIVSIKYLHWTWHDTDPNIADRHYWVPFTSYLCHILFHSCFIFFFHSLKRKTHRWITDGWKAELKSLLVSSLMGMPGGILLFALFYHPLHDVYKIHTEVIVFLVLTVYMAIIWNGLTSERRKVVHWRTTIDNWLMFYLILHYLLFLLLTIFGNPENVRSYGSHEPVGPCNEMTSVTTPLQMQLPKRKYLCVDDYDEKYFDFHCVNNQKPVNDSWYTICGTAFENRVEYIVILSMITVLAFSVFYSLFYQVAKIKPTSVPKLSKKKN